MADNVNIEMKLSSVSEVSFMMSPGKIDENVIAGDIQLGFSSNIQPDLNNNIFTLNFGVRYDLSDEVLLECLYSFVFEVNDLKQFVTFNPNKTVTVNHLMPHFLSIAVGTMRGILVVKTAGTALSKYPLPIIDINRLNSILSAQK